MVSSSITMIVVFLWSISVSVVVIHMTTWLPFFALSGPSSVVCCIRISPSGHLFVVCCGSQGQKEKDTIGGDRRLGRYLRSPWLHTCSAGCNGTVGDHKEMVIRFGASANSSRRSPAGMCLTSPAAAAVSCRLSFKVAGSNSTLHTSCSCTWNQRRCSCSIPQGEWRRSMWIYLI